MSTSLVEPKILHKTPPLLGYIIHTLPAVQNMLKQWRLKAEAIPDQMLCRQALDSLQLKAFHCQGGAVFAAVPRSQELLAFIVAYQTMCDYLDNLCDRAGSCDERAFALLHQSLPDALDAGREPADYYRYYPWQNDGGYLAALVEECRQALQSAPAYGQVKHEALQLAEWYCRLQVAKHLEIERREQVLCDWVQACGAGYPELLWQEFAAACGSTLALFVLLRHAYFPHGGKSGAEQLFDGYFPWICGLHILLDYLIDQMEDRQGGELNFTFYYATQEEMMARLSCILEESYRRCRLMPDRVFHEMVVDGLLAMYMSDRKVEQQHYAALRTRLLNQAGPAAWRTYRLCRTVRAFL